MPLLLALPVPRLAWAFATVAIHFDDGAGRSSAGLSGIPSLGCRYRHAPRRRSHTGLSAPVTLLAVTNVSRARETEVRRGKVLVRALKHNARCLIRIELARAFLHRRRSRDVRQPRVWRASCKPWGSWCPYLSNLTMLISNSSVRAASTRLSGKARGSR